MLQSKDINKISELKNGFTHRWLEPDFILGSLKCFSFSGLCKCLEPFKMRGYSNVLLLMILFLPRQESMYWFSPAQGKGQE